VAALIGRVPFFVEMNPRMPRTFGLNQLHTSQLVGSYEAERALVEVPLVVPDERDEAIAARIVERITDGATLQVGIGGVPAAGLAFLRDHRDLGIHTELLSDGIMDLVERGVVTGTHKQLRPHKVVATFALGRQRL
jgi:acyl-CoA hydrolase